MEMTKIWAEGVETQKFHAAPSKKQTCFLKVPFVREITRKRTFLQPPLSIYGSENSGRLWLSELFAGRRVFWQFSTLLEILLHFRQHDMRPFEGLGTFWQGKWLLQNRPRLWERSWILSSETATALLSISE